MEANKLFSSCETQAIGLMKAQNRGEGDGSRDRIEAMMFISLGYLFSDGRDEEIYAQRAGIAPQEFAFIFLSAIQSALLLAALRTLD